MGFFNPTVTGAEVIIVPGSTIISGGTDGRVLFDDAGVVGESAGLTYTKASGLLASTAMAIGGATLGSNALAVTGSSAFGTPASNGLSISSTGVVTMTQSASSGTVFQINGSGNGIRVVSGFVESPTFIPDTTGVIQWGGGGGLTTLAAPSNGTLKATNNAATAGVVLDFATDSTLKLFARDGTTPAALQAATVAVSSNNAYIATNQTSGAGALTGTLTNAPATGNPQFWLPVSINGTNYWLPAWHV